MNEDRLVAQLHDASRKLVATQMAWDSLLLNNEAGCLVPRDALCFTRKSVSGQQLIRLALPFYEEAVDIDPGSSAEVPLGRALGSSCSWRPEEVPERERAALQARLSHPDRANAHDEHVALATKVEPFGLYVCAEGKNRVQFLRYMGVDSMHAIVSKKTYMDPSRLRLYRAQLLGREETWAVLDDRWLRRVPLPEVTAMLLEPLGVPDAVPWPPGWPEPIRVATEIGRARELGGEYARADLHRLEARMRREEADHEQTFGAILALEGVRIRARLILAVISLVFGAGVWKALQLSGGDAAVTWTAALLLASLILLTAPILSARRGAFVPTRSTPKRGCAKRQDSAFRSVAETDIPVNTDGSRE